MTHSDKTVLITAADLNQWLDEKKAFYLIDTLPNDHFRKVHLPNAYNACVYEVTFMDQMEAITKDKNAEIVLYGSSSGSMDALTAAEKLGQAGFEQVHVLEGGIAGWRSAGLPLEGEAVADPDDPQTMLSLKDRSYGVDTNQSKIEWIGRNPHSTHFGTIGISTGEITVKGGGITGTFDIDMNTITNINLEGDELQPILISHLKSDDFFLVKRFPTATFKIHRASPVEKPFLTCPNYEINGALAMRGVKVEQNFMATISRTSENGIAAEAHFDIDRTRWNIIYGSARFFEHLGMHLVFDQISIQVRIVAS